MKFDLGTVVMTRGIAELVNEDSLYKLELGKCLNRHHNGDWGSVSKEDALLNDTAVELGEQIFSSYMTSKDRIWIITEHDRSVTTILFPSEY